MTFGPAGILDSGFTLLDFSRETHAPRQIPGHFFHAIHLDVYTASTFTE